MRCTVRIYEHEVEGVKWAFVSIRENSSYLVCIGSMAEIKEMSLAEILEARERAIVANRFENLVVPTTRH